MGPLHRGTVRSSSGLTFRAVLLPAAAVFQRSYCKYQKSQGAGTGEAGSTQWPGRAVKGAAQSLCLLSGENRVCNHSVAYKSLQLLSVKSYFMAFSIWLHLGTWIHGSLAPKALCGSGWSWRAGPAELILVCRQCLLSVDRKPCTLQFCPFSRVLCWLHNFELLVPTV